MEDIHATLRTIETRRPTGISQDLALASSASRNTHRSQKSAPGRMMINTLQSRRESELNLPGWPRGSIDR